MAGVLAVFAQLERRLIGERTLAALAVERSEGVVLGRPRDLDEHVANRIVRRGSLSAIARALTDEGVRTARGGKWHPATVRAVVRSSLPGVAV